MPTTVKQLFDAFEIKNFNKVTWWTKFSDDNEGVYIVSLSPYYDENLSSSSPIFDDIKLKYWIDKLPTFTLDGVKPTVQTLKMRLSEFWLTDESILYIGKAPNRSNGNGISNRVGEYYRTKLGDRSPHSGGQWLKTLANVNSMTVFYGQVKNSSEIEVKMFDYFMKNISQISLMNLRDKKYPLPFANLRYKSRVDKDHGLENQRKQKND